MKHGENYLITYNNMTGKTILAIFLEEVDGMYLFQDIHGKFAVTKKRIDSNEISLELIKD